MPILGCHMSIAGGHYRAAERAAAIGCDCVQVFTKNSNRWIGKPISVEEAQRFREALKRLDIKHPLGHDAYLINLASPDAALWRKSIDAFVEELHRAEALGLPYLVTHPGACTSCTEQAGLRNIAIALDEVHAQCRQLQVRCLLETTAGQGTSLGWRFEQLAAILDAVHDPDRLGICLDTCHVFAAGYPLSPETEYLATIDAFDHLLGVERIKAFHLNDSRRELGSRVDRHEHIGHGRLGLEPFRLLLSDPRFCRVPMYLETPKGESGDELDAKNLAVLRSLL
ncbi:MAG: deoxyribonuclease IV [Planctomycetaceae bacterium]|nr:deoxyribonuclease IV [Planctomycetaceae bacterium]